jgi:NAD(P)-dependent dehydrogenase (short-subunit alcohol dehydrogenase family)
VASAVEAAVAEFGRLDGAVNNAGGVVAPGPVEQLSGDGWRAELDLNLSTVFHGLKYQLPAIGRAGGGPWSTTPPPRRCPRSRAWPPTPRPNTACSA